MLVITNDDGITQMRMSHGKVNAMDIEFCRELVAALRRLAEDRSQAVLIAGSERVFSAGVDLKRWLKEGPDYVEPFLEALEDSMLAMFQFPKPMVAIVQGHAIAGGCMLACACDYRLIAPSARIGIPELRIGVPLPMTAVEIVRSVAMPQAFQRIVNVGSTFVGQGAVDVGLADEVAPVESLTARARQIAQEFQTVPLATFQLTKRQVRAPALRRMAQNRAQFFQDYLEIWRSPATRASVAEYVQNRLG